MTPDQIEAERVAFEAAMKKRYRCQMYRRELSGGYEESWIHNRWEGWLAAVESIRERTVHRQQDAMRTMDNQQWQRLAMAATHERGE